MKRLFALFALLTVGLVPAFAGAVDAPPPAPGAPAVLVKAWTTVTAVTPDAVTLKVVEAVEWVDGTETKVPANALMAQEITAARVPETVVAKHDVAVEYGTLAVGMTVRALLRTDVQPAVPTGAFALLHAAIQVPEGPKVHPGDKYEPAFFPRLWHMRGAILGLDRVEDVNVMNLDVRRLENAAKRFRDEGVRLSNMDAYVIVPAKVVITDVDGRRIAFADLDVDDRVKVVGKVLRKEKWMLDESGEPTPTVLAKRIKVKARG